MLEKKSLNCAKEKIDSIDVQDLALRLQEGLALDPFPDQELLQGDDDVTLHRIDMQYYMSQY